MAILQEAPTFSGVKTNCSVVDNFLVLRGDNGSFFDTMADVDAVVNIDTYLSESLLSAEYLFSDYVDLTDVYTVRIYSSVKGAASTIGDTVNSRVTPVNTWERFNGIVINTAETHLWISTTQDDPASPSAVWSPWNEFVLGDYTGRGFKFKLTMSVQNNDHMIEIEELSVSIDAVDRVAGEDNITIPSGGYSVVFDGAFATTPAIAVHIDNLQTGDYYRITDKTASGFTVQCFNAAGTPVSKQIDWIAKGFGRRV